MSVEFNEAYIKDLVEIKEHTKSNSHRLDEVEADIDRLKEENKALYTMNTNIEKMCMSLDYQSKKTEEMSAEIKVVKSDITDLKEAPNRTKASILDSVLKYLGTFILGGVIAYMFSQIFPQIFGL